MSIPVCAGASGLLTARLPAAETAVPTRYNRVRLQHEDGRPLTAEDLTARREHLFFYPYVSTPCFLLKLDRPIAATELHTAHGVGYRTPPGAGAGANVVAFAAICAHKLSHPARPVSFIGYRDQPVGFMNADKRIERRGAVIQCCSEHSIYDPAAGARVLAGPAPQPLAAIALEQGEGRALFATGVHGGELYPLFFERFGFRLDMEYEGRSRELVSGTTEVIDSASYSRRLIQC